MATIADGKTSMRIKAAFAADCGSICLSLAILFSTYLQLFYLCALQFLSHPLQILEVKSFTSQFTNASYLNQFKSSIYLKAEYYIKY